jgi:hypothetical protein
MKKTVKIEVKESTDAKNILPGAYVELAGQMYRVKSSSPDKKTRKITLEHR